MNHERFNHSSIVIAGYLYVMGGCKDGLIGSIECYRIGSSFPWTVIVESSELVKRQYSAMTAISSNRIAVYGGYYAQAFGYVFDTEKQEVRPILGRDGDLYFETLTHTQWIGGNRYVTIGQDNNSYYHMVQLKWESERYSEVRSVHSYGHLYLTEEQD